MRLYKFWCNRLRAHVAISTVVFLRIDHRPTKDVLSAEIRNQMEAAFVDQRGRGRGAFWEILEDAVVVCLSRDTSRDWRRCSKRVIVGLVSRLLSPGMTYLGNLACCSHWKIY